ncbi:MAG: hypothetical protein KJZ65_06560 [Phycisphaerales bacterium]|nr:hypothetical protein [Phycisphaerales bacterium]
MTIGPMSPIGPTPDGGTGVPPVDLSFARFQETLRKREDYRHQEFLKWLDSDDGERGLMLAMLIHDQVRDSVLAVLANYASCTGHNGTVIDSSDVCMSVIDAIDETWAKHTGRTYLATSNRDPRVQSRKVAP